MTNENPIGIFDSGVGGLSITRRIHELLPNENLLYVADSLHAPYGDKPESFIIKRSSAIAQYLLEQKSKAIVIACNTATVSAIVSLRSQFSVPIIGVEPGIKPAALKTVSGVIGVLATTQTLNSRLFADLVQAYSGDITVEVQACPGMMEQVEAVSLNSQKTEELVKQYVQPLLAKGVDHIVLGCTHYAFLAPLIRKIAGDDVEIINTDLAVAKETVRRLEAESILSAYTGLGALEFRSSQLQDSTQEQFSLLWGEHVEVIQM